MAKSTVAEKVKAGIEPFILAENMELVDVEYVKEGGNWYLRIYIDKLGGVDLDDCRIVSEKLDTVLDQLDPIPQAYFLEVSSPGIERPLKNPADFERFKGHMVYVATFAPIDGAKNFTGKLLDYSETGIHLDIEGNIVVVPLDKVATSRLAVEF